MKAQVFSHGDLSVGIWGNQGEIDICIDVAEDERDDYRTNIANFFSDLWEEPVTVLFEDEEFSELGCVRRKTTPLSGHFLPGEKERPSRS